MKPSYDAPYWDKLTEREKLNDLVHKIAQLGKVPYPEAYQIAARLVPVAHSENKTWPERLQAAGMVQTAIKKLIEYHERNNP